MASSPSLPSAAAAAALARARGARFVLEVRDLWPDSAIAMGLVRDRRTIARRPALEAYCYRRADRIVALTEGIRDGIVAQGVSPARITLITNGVDLEPRRPRAGTATAPRPTRRRCPTDAFVAMYVGAHGTYSSLETVLDAADHLRDRRRAAGARGRRRPQAGAGGRGRSGGTLDNVTFVDPVPKREVPAWLARADACLLPYQDNALFAGALPNKAFDYLGAAPADRRRRAARRADAHGRARRLRGGRAAGGRRGAGRRDPVAWPPTGRGRAPDGRERARATRSSTTTGRPWPRASWPRWSRLPTDSPRAGTADRSEGAPSGPPTWPWRCPLTLALAPALVGIAIWVRRDSPGPALFRQRRIGYAGRPFTLLKFRTMVVGAEGMGAGLAVVAGDDRITRAGRALRRLSLDELPQLLERAAGAT